VCLLIVLAQTHPDVPLVVGANRDEFYERPAVAMSVLRERAPRVVGGRDELAGGTWLAVNDAGVVAGLTNRPTPGGRDTTKRSRGELPLALASHGSAAEAAEALASQVQAADYNPAWLLVADRETVFAVDVTGPGAPIVDQLPPKVAHVRRLLTGVEQLAEDALVRHLQAVLSDHVVPAPAVEPLDGLPADVPPEVKAACVHTERYGTRWSGVITVPAEAGLPPSVRYADGPPCETPYTEADVWMPLVEGS
jgi:uncharacterized protein with NRDE domain